MKKKVALLLTAVMAVSLVFTGCSSRADEVGNSASGSADQEISLDNEPRMYRAKAMLKSTDYDVEDYVTLGDWKNISVDVDSSYEVTDENIKNQANELLSQYPDYKEVNEAAVKNDRVNIDYTGYINNKEFDGGSAQGYNLVLGSGQFIDGFEDGLIGHKAGEEVSLNLKFPDDYQEQSLAGKDVTFKVKVNKVERPQDMDYDHLTDEYVSDNFSKDYSLTTVKDFKNQMKETVQNQCDIQIQQAYLNKLVEESKITIPEGLADERVQTAMDSYEQTCKQYGMSLSDYISSMYGQTEDEFKASLKEQMQESLKQELVLEELVRELKCKVPSEEFINFVQYYAQQYNMSESDFIKQCGGKEYLILNYMEYYKALPEAAEKANVTYKKMDDSSDSSSSQQSSSSDSSGSQQNSSSGTDKTQQ